MANFEDFLNLILWQEKRIYFVYYQPLKFAKKMTFADKDFLFLFYKSCVGNLEELVERGGGGTFYGQSIIQ